MTVQPLAVENSTRHCLGKLSLEATLKGFLSPEKIISFYDRQIQWHAIRKMIVQLI